MVCSNQQKLFDGKKVYQICTEVCCKVRARECRSFGRSSEKLNQYHSCFVKHSHERCFFTACSRMSGFQKKLRQYKENILIQINRNMGFVWRKIDQKKLIGNLRKLVILKVFLFFVFMKKVISSNMEY